jgi:hypothetical protein
MENFSDTDERWVWALELELENTKKRSRASSELRLLFTLPLKS